MKQSFLFSVFVLLLLFFFRVLKNPRKILKQKVMNPDEFFHRLPITGSILVF